MTTLQKTGNNLSDFYYNRLRFWLGAFIWLCALVGFNYFQSIYAAIDQTQCFDKVYTDLQIKEYAWLSNLGLLFFVIFDFYCCKGKEVPKYFIITFFIGLVCVFLINRWSLLYASGYFTEHFNLDSSFNYAYIPHIILLCILLYIRIVTIESHAVIVKQQPKV